MDRPRRGIPEGKALRVGKSQRAGHAGRRQERASRARDQSGTGVAGRTLISEEINSATTMAQPAD